LTSSTASPSDRSISLTLLAPLSGLIVPLERVPDPAFARKLAGDGVALDPLDQRLVAPCDARVLHVHRAGHALTLSASGLEVLMHVGLDTVNLNGQGFEPRVKAGDEVRAGDLLLTFDADYVARHARSLITPVLVVSMDRVAALQAPSGRVIGGQDTLLEVRLAGAGPAATARAQGRSVESPPVVIASEAGLHAPRRGDRRRGAPFRLRRSAGQGRPRRERPQRRVHHDARDRARRCGDGRRAG
jgi:glucose-specific phosphotransferase system IIA component